MQIFDL